MTNDFVLIPPPPCERCGEPTHWVNPTLCTECRKLREHLRSVVAELIAEGVNAALRDEEMN